jgi:CheY-like chemotaxis protein
MSITEPAVLYVEDDPQSRKLMSILLKNRMKLSDVTILEDSQNFVANVTAIDPKPDVILLDIHMRPHNGFEMLEMLRQIETFSDTPIVALTASVMNEEVQKLRSIGFNGCLAKPIDLQTFPETLERILDGETIWRIFN